MSKIESSFKTILIMSFLIVLGGFALISAMTIVYSLPLNQANYIESLEILNNEGARPDVLERNSGDWSNATGFEPGIVLTTDEIANVYRAGGVEGMSPLYNVVVMDAPEWGPYARYWHTHVAVIRMLLMAMDIKEMRFLFFIIQLLCICLIMMLVRDKKGFIPSLMVLTFYILNMPLSISAFTDYSVCMCVILALSLYVLWHLNKSDNSFKIIRSGRFYIWFCIMGCLVCSTDQLISGVMSWGILITLVIFLYCEKNSIKDNLKMVVLSALSWIYGYAGFWIFKIAFATIYLHEDIFADAIGRTEAWTEGTDAYSPGRLISLITVYKHYTYKLFAGIIILWIVFLTVRMLFAKLTFDSRIPSLFLVALGPLAWGFVLYEHIYYHHIMTYRQLSVTVVAILLSLYCVTDKERLKLVLLKNNLKMSAFLIVTVLISLVLTSFMSETQDLTNSDVPGYYLQFDCNNPVMTMDITPRFDRITELSMGISVASSEGKFIFRLVDGDNVLDEYEVLGEQFASYPWVSMPIDWKVKKGKLYKLIITAEGIAPGAGLYVLNSEYGTLKDVSNLWVGNLMAETQPVTRIRYSRHPLWRDYIFYSASWFACIMALAFTFLCMVKKND